MNPNLPSTIVSVSTGLKNVFDIATHLIGIRRQNRMITSAQLERLNVAIQAAIQADRIAAVHKLESSARSFLIDTYRDIEEDLNTPIGDMLLESLQREAKAYSNCMSDFAYLTRPGGYR